jgi:hypothetical protein
MTIHELEFNIKRNWRKDYHDVEEFCKHYGFGYGEHNDDDLEYSIFFVDSDRDEIECVMSNRSDDIIFSIPLNERDLETDICGELKRKCDFHDILCESIMEESDWEIDWENSIEMTEDLFLHPEKLNDIVFPKDLPHNNL